MSKEEKRSHELEKRIAQLEEEVKDFQDLKRHVINLEAQSRRDNLIVDDIPEAPREDCSVKIKGFLTDQLEINTDITFERAHRLRLPLQKNPRPLKFHFFPDRELVWSKQSMIENRDFGIREDNPASIVKECAILRPFLRAAIEQKNSHTAKA